MRGPMLSTGEEKHAMYIHNWENTDLTHEPAYNVRAQRLPKFAEADESYAGGAWVVVAPDTTMTEHVRTDAEGWTIGLSENARRLGETELPLVLPRPVVGILAVRVILWQSDRGADPVALTQDIRDAFGHTRLSSVLSTLTSSPATMMTVANVRDAAGELGREIAPVLRALSTDYVDFFEGFYPAINCAADEMSVTEEFTGYHSQLLLRKTHS